MYTLFAVAAVLGLGFSVRAARGVLDARAPDSAELDDVADLLVDLQIQEKRAEQVPITEPGPRSPTVPDAIARMRTERPELYERVQQKRRERGLPPYPDPPD